jgi:hypothetical protein
LIVWACIALITVLAWSYLLHLDREMVALKPAASATADATVEDWRLWKRQGRGT